MGKFSLEKISINQAFNYMIFFFFCLYKFLKTKTKKQNGISTWNEFASFKWQLRQQHGWIWRVWHPTPVFLPGESQGRGSLVGWRVWGRTESDMTEATWQQQQSFFVFCGLRRRLSRYTHCSQGSQVQTCLRSSSESVSIFELMS